jgi:hypothetical protein
MYLSEYIYSMEGDLINIKMHHGGSFSMDGPLMMEAKYLFFETVIVSAYHTFG